MSKPKENKRRKEALKRMRQTTEAEHATRERREKIGEGAKGSEVGVAREEHRKKRARRSERATEGESTSKEKEKCDGNKRKEKGWGGLIK